MAKIIKKGTTGNAAQYLTRNQALKKLQLKLSQFRRLCILKGIHPREPKKKPAGQHKTYYHVKDISYLLHEPLLKALREQHAYQRKLRKARARRSRELLERLTNRQPSYRLDHLVRERYPSFVDALRDLDDPLTLTHLFAVLPAEQAYDIPPPVVAASRRLALEFQAWAVRTHALRKVFVSVKGYYFQAEVMGQPITWLVPHATSQVLPPDVDYRVLLTFLEFYHTLLGFVNYKLYHTLGLRYPPVLDARLEQAAAGLEALMRDLAGGEEGGGSEAMGKKEGGKEGEGRERAVQRKRRQADVSEALRRLHRDGGQRQALEDDDEDENAEDVEGEEEDVEAAGSSDEEEEEEEGVSGQQQGEEEAAGGSGAGALVPAAAGGSAALVDPDDDAAMCEYLFHGLVFFLGREVPREQLMFVIRAFGGAVGWEGEGSPFGADCRRITHQVVDRPKLQGERCPGREYVQPQWVFDSANFRVAVPTDLYAPGARPPPHLSPFVNADEEGYVPEYGQQLQQLREADVASRRRALGVGDQEGEEGGGAFVGDGGPAAAAGDAPAAGGGLDLALAEQRYAEDLRREIKEVAAGSDAEDEEQQQQQQAKGGKAARRSKRQAEAGSVVVEKQKQEPTVPQQAEEEEEDEDAAAERMAVGLLSRKKRRLVDGARHKEELKRNRVEKLQRKKRALAQGGV